MKNGRLAVVLAAIGVIAIAGFVVIPRHRERVHIRDRVEGIRRALRNNDMQSVATFVLPERPADPSQKGKSHYRIPLADYRMRVGTDHSAPSIWISGNTANVTPHVQYHFGIIPGGDSLEMAKENGEWYFTGRLFID